MHGIIFKAYTAEGEVAMLAPIKDGKLGTRAVDLKTSPQFGWMSSDQVSLVEVLQKARGRFSLVEVENFKLNDDEGTVTAIGLFLSGEMTGVLHTLIPDHLAPP